MRHYVLCHHQSHEITSKKYFHYRRSKSNNISFNSLHSRKMTKTTLIQYVLTFFLFPAKREQKCLINKALIIKQSKSGRVGLGNNVEWSNVDLEK